MGLFTRRVKRLGTDRYRITLPEHEADLLRNLLPQLRGLLTTGMAENDPSLTRLFPTAYANDPELDAGYQALVRDELLEKRFGSLDVIEALLAEADGGEVDGDELSAWMRAINDLRLVLGTRLDVGEDDDPSDIDPDDPDAPAWAIYHYLAMLVSVIVDALTEDL
ncbi:DUF2017 family protein [Actinospongicola halichondriae]|uniref:DUF2017 family protein n=1 Tax=Actinospongicola halichondriae TaxID=3236844 RepID=UPI003D5D3D93